MNPMIVLKIKILILIKNNKYNPDFCARPAYNYNLVTIIYNHIGSQYSLAGFGTYST